MPTATETGGHPLIETILAVDSAIRDRSIPALIAGLSTAEVLDCCDALESFRRVAGNLYERVRASVFLHWLYRYRLQEAPDLPTAGLIPHAGVADLLERRFESAGALAEDLQRYLQHKPVEARPPSMAYLMQRFARRYSPAVLLSGALVLVLGGFIGGDWSTWAERAATFIVAAAPCALVISIPMSYVAAIGNASR